MIWTKAMQRFSIIIVCLFTLQQVNGQEVVLTASKNVEVKLTPVAGKSYQFYMAPSASGPWEKVATPIPGNGVEITAFVSSQNNPKIFLKVEEIPSELSQVPLESLARLNLSRRNLDGYDLHGKDLQFFSFVEGTLRGANLAGVNAARANFEGADFTSADLRNANFTDCS